MTSSPFRRAVVWFSHVYPLLMVAAVTLFSAIPRIFFLYEEAAQDTLSLFQLMKNASDISHAMLASGAEAGTATVAFSKTVLVLVALSVVCLVLVWIAALLETVLGCYTLSLVPSSDAANKAKRWFRFLCPNRVLLFLSHVLLLVPLLFPQMLGHFYNLYLAISVKPRYLGIPDLWLMIALLLVDLVLLFATLPWQDSEHMNLYRLYRKRNTSDR